MTNVNEKELLLRFQIEVLKQVPSLSEDLAEQIVTAESFLEGKVSADDRQAKADEIWDWLRAEGKLSCFDSKDLLIKRLSLCLLNRSSTINEDLDWFFELADLVDKKLGTTIFNNAKEVFEQNYAQLVK